ncbi:hypothetical protein [Microbacterium sp.]|uniref:hypothetical protein n=1 Tax=Microbacterium sp. TaxID=51671 RepID=UPI003A8E6EA0
MFQAEIRVDGDIVAVHSSHLTSQNEQVPSGTRVGQVHGDDREHATASFLRRLESSATMVGTHADKVRVAVKSNADALKKAVREFEEQDEHAKGWAKSRNDMIDQTAKNTTDPSTSSSPQNATSTSQGSTESGSSTSTGNM